MLFNECFCENTEYKIYRDFGENKILECSNCGLYRSFPLPTESVSGDNYQQINDIQELHYHQLCVLRKVMKAANSKSAKILDVGCSTGNMLMYLKNKGYKNISGVDMNDFAINISQQKNLNVKKMDSEKLVSDDKYDVIYLNHVLEHIGNLKEFISKVSRILLNGSHLIIAVPNINGKYTNSKDWIGYQFSQHYWHFTSDSLEKIFKENNFKLIDKTILTGGRIKSKLFKLFKWEGDSLISVFKYE